MTRLALAFATFAAGCAALAHHDRPTLTAPPRVTAPDASRALEHPSRAARRHPLTVRRHTPTASHRRWSLRTVTAYCATGSRNAAGNWPSLGTAAGNAWPLGTRLLVRTVGPVVVEDRSAPGATDVDIYIGSDQSCAARASRFGRRQLLVAEVSR